MGSGSEVFHLVPSGFKELVSETHVRESSFEHNISQPTMLVLTSGDAPFDAQPHACASPMALASSVPDVGKLTVRCMIRVGFQGLRECALPDLKRGIEGFMVRVASLEAAHPEGQTFIQLRQRSEDLAG
ncbi:hypothetical protein AMTR_s00020p00108180 [Amborella trichopoda]|uniref:Uncharacterized protein n=1 Tax=Amborella trichopoda TaxID=13333 RepID=W1PWU3_AMBTC|nr:hypothetical protein AMTR_s00020p00108180 [Amborella trichopoda]